MNNKMQKTKEEENQKENQINNGKVKRKFELWNRSLSFYTAHSLLYMWIKKVSYLASADGFYTEHSFLYRWIKKVSHLVLWCVLCVRGCFV
jgi:hypothetical protein